MGDYPSYKPDGMWPILLIYSLFSFLLDNTQSTGESIYRTSQWMRNLFIYEGFVDYFPIITHRTVQLPASINYITKTKRCLPPWTRALPSKLIRQLKYFGVLKEKERNYLDEIPVGPRYIFACHPHGVISFGITGALCWGGKSEIYETIIEDDEIIEKKENCVGESHTLTSSKSFVSLFSNIPTHLLTLTTQFKLPFYRDYIMALGVGLVTKCGIKSILKRWHSVAIVVGGAHESLLARPGSNRIVLNRRKGFIKIALEECTKIEKDRNNDESFIEKGEWNSEMSDIAIVPVYAFGENNIHNVFNTVEGQKSQNSQISNTMRIFLKFQLTLKKYTGFTIPIVNSRSIFNYDFGLLPYKRRIDVVFGEPIYIYRKFGAKVGDKVTESEVNYYHELYKERLLKLC
ncbi:hypothetical protein CANINC_001252 [Pichia inconspicua]|uniref:Diacylglycerol O-acyltransferase n=1 Tax=Pichia inconspicua TaxID=52247 RepID=A0A4V4NG09_9ASCO|nr:hypothetical protein CANINC_001252 [[Candida] inconspicua]